MNPALILAAAAGVTALGALARGTTPAPRIFVGAAVGGVVLAGFASLDPQLASRFAGVVLITALLTSGYDVAKGVQSALNR